MGHVLGIGGVTVDRMRLHSPDARLGRGRVCFAVRCPAGRHGRHGHDGGCPPWRGDAEFIGGIGDDMEGRFVLDALRARRGQSGPGTGRSAEGLLRSPLCWCAKQPGNVPLYTTGACRKNPLWMRAASTLKAWIICTWTGTGSMMRLPRPVKRGHAASRLPWTRARVFPGEGGGALSARGLYHPLSKHTPDGSPERTMCARRPGRCSNSGHGVW